jgi:hypothetical protein|tara:strand:+ start:702 stop:974 length:273 start_codon:yes stop_codon:yes gene_type:complete
MQKNDVVSVMTAYGEYVGKYVQQGTSVVTLSDPRMIVQTEQGMGFAHGICATGKENPTSVDIQMSQVVFVTEVNSQIEKEYRKVTSGLIV